MSPAIAITTLEVSTTRQSMPSSAARGSVPGYSVMNARSVSGATALMKLAGTDNAIEIARLLLAAGADVDAADENGWTPLVHATIARDEELVELLIDAGARSVADNPARRA